MMQRKPKNSVDYEKTAQVNVRVSKELAHKLKVYCARTGIPRNKLLEDYIKEVVKEEKL